MRTTAAPFLAASFLTGANAFIMPQVAKPAFYLAPLQCKQSGGFTADSGLTVNNIPLFIDNLNPDNFEESLAMLEPLLTNECVGDQCDTFLEDVRAKAAAMGKIKNVATGGASWYFCLPTSRRVKLNTAIRTLRGSTVV
jgi:hypothetical protein